MISLSDPAPGNNATEGQALRDGATIRRGAHTGQAGWPWGDLEDASARYADADERELETRVLDHPAAREQAIADKWQAMTDRQTTREEITRLILGGLRITLGEQPHQLRSILSEAAGSRPTIDADVQTAFAEVFRRLEKLEGGRC